MLGRCWRRLFPPQVSIVTFGPKKIKDRNVGKLIVRGKGWDATLGGWWFGLELANMLAESFNTKVCVCESSLERFPRAVCGTVDAPH